MSRKQILTKKVTHTILAMSIVSAGGLNLWAGTAWAAANGNNGADDTRENVSISDSVDISVAGGNGTDGAAGSGTDDAGGNGGNGGAASFSGTLTVNDRSKAVSVTVKGGNGGNGGAQSAQTNAITGNGGSGGDAELQLTVGSNVQTGALTLAAEAGNGGKSGSDTSGTAPTSEVTVGNGGAGGNAAAGIAITDGSLTATSISLTIKAGDAGNNGYISKEGKDNHGGDGGTAGTAAMRGIVLSGQQAAVKVTNDIIISGTGGRGGAGGSTYGEAGLAAVGGAAEAYGLVAAGSGVYSVSFANLTLTATGGDGGSGGTAQTFQADTNNSHGDRYKSNDGADGGSAASVGLTIQNGSMQLTAEAISSTAAGGTGGNAGWDNNANILEDSITHANAGQGGEATATGIAVQSLLSNELAVGVITATATGGDGGSGANGSYADRMGAEVGGIGGNAFAYSVWSSGTMAVAAGSIKAEAVGGTGGTGGTGGRDYASSDVADGASGGIGGNAFAYSVWSSGTAAVTADSIKAAAVGGSGGTGAKGVSYAASNGGNGGTGGNAFAYGVRGSEQALLTLTVDSIAAEAAAGTGGAGGSKGSYGGSSGVDGSAGGQGAQAEAYGVYADSGSVITLSAKTNGGTITIGAKASNTETQKGSKAYAVYADNATVLFNDKAVLNSDGSSTDNDVITYLNNATFGFGSPGEGQNVGRTIDGGTLQLTGSNTFKVAADLSNVTPNADKFTFAKLAADSSTATQYITVGYDKAFDGSSLDSFIGEVTVLTVTNLEHGQNLNNFVGKESVMDDPLTRFLATPTVTVDGNDVKITQIDFEEAGASETVMTAADAQMALGSMWRIEGNNLMKRMGELRSDKEAAQGGVWARYYRGELSADSAYDREFSQDYTAFQGGIDKVQDYKGGKLYTGIAVNRIDSNAGYTAGSGDLSSTGVGVYASWLGSKGHYIDVIARGSKLTNDFKLVDPNTIAAKADYDTWAYGISTEYGYRQNLNAGWFVEPQAELSLGHIGSVDYTTSNEVSVKQDSVNSAVVRLGFLGGKEFTIGGRTSNAYVKASALHDFGGNGGGTAYYKGRSTVVESADMNGTWYEIGLGANLGIAKNSNLYFDALKTFGGDLRTDWQFNAGLRFTF
ncbi:autotransporter outer membrane beta-barrel domain-containing protein [Phascolarctobacterium faecium]|uniref:autotransporter outer membrane beta-barrel domain-containing protein n=1 Tax=Phascolarctobacterium faecium TaxID=33025 RepID=UPI003AF1037D